MKKGFTLIELLAVIVILAVLALIATPIVLNIIDDSKESATLRSSENYIKAIEFSIAKSVMENKRLSDGTYPIMSNGSICIGTLTGSTCSDTLVVEVAGETPESGNITIKSRKIDSYEFTYKSGFVVINGEINEGENNNLTLAQFILKQAKNNNYYYETTPDFSKEISDGEYGLYQATDDLGTSYYFRGDTEDNYVKFGKINYKEVWYLVDNMAYELGTFDSAEECLNSSYYEELMEPECRSRIYYGVGTEVAPMYWRIVRINGDETIRIIFDGVEKKHNGIAGEVSIANTQLSESVEGNPRNYDEMEYLKTSLNNWYSNNLENSYSSNISDGEFCNDMEKIGEFDGGIEIDSLYSAAHNRIVNNSPKLSCKNEYVYSLSNDKLLKPIGTMSIDEILMAGRGNNTYLNRGGIYWTISLDRYDYSYDDMYVYTSSFGSGYIYFVEGTSHGVRPVINLKADVNFTGDGSYDNPYVIVTE